MAPEGALRQSLPEHLLISPPPCSLHKSEPLLLSQAHQAELFGDLRAENLANRVITRKLLPTEPHLELAGYSLVNSCQTVFPFFSPSSSRYCQEPDKLPAETKHRTQTRSEGLGAQANLSLLPPLWP